MIELVAEFRTQRKPAGQVAATPSGRPAPRRREILDRLADRPDNADILYELALSYLRQGNVRAGRRTARRARERGLDPSMVSHLKIEACFRAEGWSLLASQTAPDRDFDVPAIETPWLRIAVSRLRLGDTTGAKLAIDSYLRLRPNDLGFVLPLARMLDLPKQDKDLARLIRDIADTGVDPALIEAACARLATETGTRIALDRLTRQASHQSSSASKLARDWAKGVLQVSTLPAADRPGPDVMDEMATTLQIALDGHFVECVAALLALEATPVSAFSRLRLEEVRQLIERLADAPEPDRDILDDAPVDVAVSQPGTSRRIAMVFTGLSERVSGLPISIFDRLLALAGYRTIFLRDPSRFAFACGIRSVAPSARATIEALRPLVDMPDRAELLVIGASGGGYASLRYGLELAADRIVVISGGTVCHPDDLARIGDDRVPVVARRTVKRAGPDDFTAPVHEVLHHYPHRPLVNLHFGEDMAVDRAHAMLLDGQDGITLHACPNTARHNIIAAVLGTIIPGRRKPFNS